MEFEVSQTDKSLIVQCEDSNFSEPFIGTDFYRVIRYVEKGA